MTELLTRRTFASRRKHHDKTLRLHENNVPSRAPGTFSIRTLLLTLGTASFAFGMLTWSSIGPLVLQLATAILLYWFGAICMTLSERQFAGFRVVLLMGCVAMSTAVLVGFFGTLFVAGLWIIAATST